MIEDAWLEDGCREALAGAEERLSFDAPIHSWSDVGELPLEPRWLNIKPSRFGTLRKLLECIEECEERGIQMYGGGQFELGPGRRQIQRLASLFYADGPNDVAPSEYNDGPARERAADEPAAGARRSRVLMNLFDALPDERRAPASARSSARRCGAERSTSSRRGSASARITGTSARRSGCSSSRARRRCARRRASRCCARGTSRCSSTGEAGAHEVRNDTDEPVRVVMLSSVSDPEVCVYPDSGKVGVFAGWSRKDGQR